MPNLVIRTIWCHATQGIGKDDLGVSISTDNGPWVWGFKGKMSAGTGHVDINLSFPFSEVIGVRFVERDSGSEDDLIGDFNASSGHAGSDEKKTVLAGDGSKYEVTWRVD